MKVLNNLLVKAGIIVDNYVAIGTDSPYAGYNIDSRGSHNFGNTSTEVYHYFQSSNVTGGSALSVYANNLSANSSRSHIMLADTAASVPTRFGLGVYTGASPYAYLDSASKLVINNASGANVIIGGITDDGYRLDVLGSGRFTSYLNVNHTNTNIAALDVRATTRDITLYIDNTRGTGTNYAGIFQASGVANNIAGYFNATYGVTNVALKADYGDVILNNASGTTTIGSLAGTGNRMVVVNSSGVLSTQAIPSGNAGTVTSVGLSSATSGVTIGSSPITTSGTITLAIATASGSQQGLLSSTDWTTFNNKQNALTNPITGTGTSGQVAYFNGTNSITSNAAFAFTPTSQLLVNNSVTASGAIARGTNLTPTLTAAANNDVLVGLDVNPTFTNGSFTGVSNLALRVQGLTTIRTLASNFNNPLLVENTGTAAQGNKNVATFIGARGNASNIDDNTNIAVWQKDTTVNNYGLVTFLNSIGNLSSYIGAQYLSHSSGQSANLVLGTVNAGTVATKMTVFNTGNVLIQNGGTFTDAGFRLDVNGTARVQGNLNVSTGGLTVTTGGITLVQGTMITDLGLRLAVDLNGDLGTSGIRFFRAFINTINTTTINADAINTRVINASGSITAASAIARGVNFTNTLVAAANNDVLVGLDINPAFNNGAFTLVSNIALRTSGGIALINSSSIIGTAAYPLQVVGNSGGSALFSNASRTQALNINLTTAGETRIYGDYFGAGVDQKVILGTYAGRTSQLVLHTTNNVGINTTTDAGFRLDVNGTARVQSFTTINAAPAVNAESALLVQPTTNNSTASAGLYGIYNNATVNTIASTSSFTGIYSRNSIGSTLVQASGVQGDVNISAGTTAVAIGFTCNSAVTGTGTASTFIGYNFTDVFKAGSGAVTRQIGIRIMNLTAGGTANVGLLFNNAGNTSVSGTWDIYSQSGNNSYLAGSIGIGASTINASAKVQIDSTNSGFLPPRMTSAQRTAISTPAEGLIVYQTDGTIGLYVYANATWRTLAMV